MYSAPWYVSEPGLCWHAVPNSLLLPVTCSSFGEPMNN
jgi:hypothetical protein